MHGDIDVEYVASKRREIGQRIQQLRKLRGMTVQHLADDLDVKVTTIEKIEAGKWLSLEVLIKIAVKLEFDIELLPR